MFDKETLHKLNIKYASEGLDLLKAVRTWKDLKFSSDDIRNQVLSDIGMHLADGSAQELYHLGAAMKCDYDSINKPYEVGKGREKLLPDNIKNKSVKLSPAIKMSMERVGQNLYRDKKAKTYWTMKEKVADNGEKVIFLVAIEEQDDDVKKTAAVPEMGIKPSEGGTETTVTNIKATGGESGDPMKEQGNKDLKNDIHQIGGYAQV